MKIRTIFSHRIVLYCSFVRSFARLFVYYMYVLCTVPPYRLGKICQLRTPLRWLLVLVVQNADPF